MTGTINLNLCPFNGKLVINGTSLQHITLNSNRKQIIYRAISKQRTRVFFYVCKFLGEKIQENATKPIKLDRLETELQKWMDEACCVSFQLADMKQSATEAKLINAGKRAVLEGLGLNQSNYVSHEDDTSPTPSEELVNASEPEPVAEPAEPTTKTFTLPISSQKAVTLTIPIDLTKDEAELIANSSLEYLRALLLSQYKE
jgi:hypothetical protein